MDRNTRMQFARVVGALVLSDGKLSERERDHVDDLMGRLGLSGADMQQALASLAERSLRQDDIYALQDHADLLLKELRDAAKVDGWDAAEDQLIRNIEATLRGRAEGPPAAPPGYRVRVQIGDGAGELSASQPRLVLGRASMADLQISSDSSVSRRHCELFLEHGTTYIRDLGSANGTWVGREALGAQAVPLGPGSEVFVGRVPLELEWQGTGSSDGSTRVVQLPEALRLAMEARKNQLTGGGAPATPAAAAPAAQAAEAPRQRLDAGGSTAPLPADYAYRRQDSTKRGVLLVALPGDTFQNNTIISGYLEFEAMGKATIASITVELAEFHKKGSSKGHVWDRVIVRQGPWKSKKGDVLPMPFELRVPPGTSVSGRDVYWEVHGLVDVDWSSDIETRIDITMRNTDIEKLRDALGSLDYRIVDLSAQPRGQRFEGSFQPPAQLRKEIGIDTIELVIEYLGSNIKVDMIVQKSNFWGSTRKAELVFELERLRGAEVGEVAQLLYQQIQQLMEK